MDEILIQGDMVSLRSVSETRKVSTGEFYESLSLAAGMMTPILPQSVIFYAAREGRNIFVTHETPQLRKLKVKHGNQEKEYSVKLPHVYFFHKYQYSAFEDLFVYGANFPAEALTDMLHILPLKNLYADCRVCLGRDLKFNLEGRLSGKIIKVEDHFWNSVFNSDLDGNYKTAAPEGWEGDPLSYWQILSEEPDFDPCEIQWQQWGTWKDVVNKLLEKGS
ncbi:MAG: hypothetical protein PHV82_11855 [Victivallaceae bacterium]|nr:hypothetical protein [Victivallaceae bacterium]